MSFVSDIFAGGTEGVLKGVKDVVSTFKADPLELAKLESALAQAELTLQTQMQAAVNASMQAESKSEHWMQWAWRPTFGFTGAGLLINNYILLPYFQKIGIQSIDIPTEVWLMLMAVLGVAAWTRGQEKINK